MRLRARWIGAAVLCVGLMLGVSSALAQSDEPTPNGETEQTASAERSEDHIDEFKWEWTPENLAALSTVFVAAFTGILVVVTLLNARQNKRETKILQRAYVAANPGGVKVLNDPTNDAIGDVWIRNVGRLPAANVRWAIWCDFSAEDREEDITVDENMLEGGVTLPPGGCALQGSPQFIGKSMTYRSPNLYLYVWGLIRYDDGFGEARKTTFCHRYNCVNYDIVSRSIGADAARVHRYGNKAT